MKKKKRKGNTFFSLTTAICVFFNVFWTKYCIRPLCQFFLPSLFFFHFGGKQIQERWSTNSSGIRYQSVNTGKYERWQSEKEKMWNFHHSRTFYWLHLLRGENITTQLKGTWEEDLFILLLIDLLVWNLEIFHETTWKIRSIQIVDKKVRTYESYATCGWVENYVLGRFSVNL